MFRRACRLHLFGWVPVSVLLPLSGIGRSHCVSRKTASQDSEVSQGHTARSSVLFRLCFALSCLLSGDHVSFGIPAAASSRKANGVSSCRIVGQGSVGFLLG